MRSRRPTIPGSTTNRMPNSAGPSTRSATGSSALRTLPCFEISSRRSWAAAAINYLLLADYSAYIACQERVSDTYRRPEEWTKKSILNTAHMEKFSTDRTIKEYADAIWGLKPVQIEAL